MIPRKNKREQIGRKSRLTLYLTEEENRIIAEASQAESLSTGSFARSVVLKVSKQILQEEG